MEENKFEKDIRRELEGMKITPSDNAWANVEKRIGKKKDRRRLALLLAFLALCIAAGGYFFIHSGDNNRPALATKDTIQNQTRSHSRPADSAVESEKAQLQPSTTSSNNAESFPKRQSPVTGSTLSVLQGNTSKTKHLQRPAETGLPEPHTSKLSTHLTPGSQLLPTDDQRTEVTATPADSATIPRNTITHTQTNDSTNVHTISDTGAGIKSVVGKKHTSERKKNKWQWSLNFSIGNSNAGNSLFEMLGREKNLPLYQNDPGSSPGQQPGPVPSLPRHSRAFTSGIAATKSISPKSKLSAGLNYKYFSTTNKVGSPVNNQTGSFYSTMGNQTNYHNKFHFIEVPLNIRVRLTKQAGFPVYWKAGISVSQLVASNALQFESGKYFTDNSMFHKTQLGFTTGMVITLFANKNIPVNIGPEIYYGATKLATGGLYQQKHFSSFGLHTEIFFRKKQ